MKIVIATDGSLDPELTAATVSRLAADGGEVSVLTVVEVPRTMLAELRAVYSEKSPIPSIDRDAEYVSTTSPPATVSPHWPGDDAMIARYVEGETARRTGAIVDALDRHGVPARAVGTEDEDPAGAILRFCTEVGADLLCLGSHGRGHFEGLLGSISVKLTRRAPCSVLLIRS